jgi:hypothetical protein
MDIHSKPFSFIGRSNLSAGMSVPKASAKVKQIKIQYNIENKDDNMAPTRIAKYNHFRGIVGEIAFIVLGTYLIIKNIL